MALIEGVPRFATTGLATQLANGLHIPISHLNVTQIDYNLPTVSSSLGLS